MLEGFDFGVGMLLPSLGRDMKERDETARDDRARLGRQRGMAPRRRWRNLRCVPPVVRDDVLRFLPRAAPDPRSSDPPRRLVRVARTGHERALEECVDVGEYDLFVRCSADLGDRTREPLLRHTDRFGRHFTGSFSDLFSWYTVLAGLAFVAALRFHGAVFLTLRTVGDLCERATRSPRGSRPSPSSSERLPHRDARCRSRSQRQERLPGSRPRHPGGDGGDRGGCSARLTVMDLRSQRLRRRS